MKNKPGLVTSYLYSISSIIILFFLLTGFLLIRDEFSNFHRESRSTRTCALETRKSMLKNEVEKIVDYINYQKSLAEKRLRETVKNRALEARRMATFIYEQNRRKPRSEIRRLIHDALYGVAWDQGKGYYFAEDMNGTEIVNRNNPDLEGINIINLQDSKGTYLMREILAVARSEKREGFCSYYWNKPDQPEVLVPKISYVTYFAPLDWVIGTGKYLEDEEKLIQQEVLLYLKKIDLQDTMALQIGTWQGQILSNSADQDSSVPTTADKITIGNNADRIATARAGGGFLYLDQPTGNSQPTAGKISYSQSVTPWQWYISAVIDLQAVENSIQQRQQKLKNDTRKKIIEIGLALCFLLLSAGVIAHRMSQKIRKNLIIFDNFFAEAAGGNARIEQELISFTEFDNLARAANTMITERNQAEKAFQESEHRLFKVVENAQIAMAIIREDGRTEFLNNQFSSLFGYTANDIPDMQHWWELAYPDLNYRQKAQEAWFAVLERQASGKPFTSSIWQVKSKDGSIREIRFNCTPVGRHSLIACHDYTELQQTVRDKERLLIELEQLRKSCSGGFP
ncbi:MAG: cache domain-containing protein [Deltaproteobacteria bacterium]|nr:cache domain-containing protein [Deltaproteobacteria bacterium]